MSATLYYPEGNYTISKSTRKIYFLTGERNCGSPFNIVLQTTRSRRPTKIKEESMAKQKMIAGSDAIRQVCAETKYSRSHVAVMLRDHAKRLCAKFDFDSQRWSIPRASVLVLRELVQKRSGKRYRLGERGPHQ